LEFNRFAIENALDAIPGAWYAETLKKRFLVLLSPRMEKAVLSNKNKHMPESLKPFFWDVDFEKLSASDYSHFIISRLMEHGDEVALHFLMHTYSRQELLETLKTSRSLSRRSRKFWALLLDAEEESCTATRYPSPFEDCSWD
jgi:hypothetical protein